LTEFRGVEGLLVTAISWRVTIVLLLELDAGEAHSVRWVIDASASYPRVIARAVPKSAVTSMPITAILCSYLRITKLNSQSSQTRSEATR